MKIAFRTTASRSIGYGHLRRCLTLAQASQATCVFFLPEDMHHLVDGFETRVWARAHGCDVVVCDDYTLDGDDVRDAMVLDDPMQRNLFLARWIVNPTIGAHYPSSAEQLTGPRYALLRDEFRALPARQVGAVKRVLVTLGGSDPNDRTLQVVRALSDFTLDVVVGPLFSDKQKEELAALPVALHVAPESLAPLMLAADMCVCAGGQTVYEAAACGLPALAIELADNQRLNLQTLSAAGVLRVANQIADDARSLANDTQARQSMSSKGQALVDGLGAQRVASVLR